MTLVIEILNNEDNAREAATGSTGVVKTTTAGGTIDVLDTGSRMSEAMGRRLLRALSFAKDLNQRLRVVVDSGSSNLGYIAASFWQQGTYNTLYSAGPWTVDERENMRLQMRANMIAVRQGRWVIT